MMRKASYENFKRLLDSIQTDLNILAGNEVGTTDATWQDVAGTLATNMEAYAALLHEARKGRHEAFLSFPALGE